jgi:oxygen-independent coproporphyrinogen III oxidase
MRPISLYIHIPLCKSFCLYCDFYKKPYQVKKEAQLIDSIKKQIDYYVSAESISKIKTLYIGGGDPGCLSEEKLEELLACIDESFDLEKCKERTIELNPENITEKKLAVVKKYGITRISIGVQSFNDAELKFLGRKHTSKTIYTAIDRIKSSGIKNINIDLIYGWKNGNKDSIIKNIEIAKKLKIPHVSYYELSIEKGTPFFKNKVEKETSDRLYDQYELINKNLKKNGYRQYEISAYSEPGFQCDHNKTYWRYKPYIGVGDGAYSLFRHKHYESRQISTAKPLSTKEQMDNFIMMNLRLSSGFLISQFNKRFNQDFMKLYGRKVEDLAQKKMVTLSQSRLKATKKGRNLLNEILLDLLF